MPHAFSFDMSVTNINTLKVLKILVPVGYFCILPNFLQHAIIPSRNSTNMGSQYGCIFCIFRISLRSGGH